MAKAKRVLDFYASKSWAMLPENLVEMYGIYQAAIDRKVLDVDFDTEAVAAKLGRPLDNSRTVTVRDGVAILPISGPIFRYANLFTEISGATSIEVLATDFRQALDDRSVRAILLEINSPGGEVDGTSELAQHIFEARRQKPVIAYVSYLGASAAYWIASACDEIVCSDVASLGSIGVVGAVYIQKSPHRVEFVSSQSPNKRPNVETESGRAQIQSHIDSLADVFIETVARNRNMTAEDVVDKGGAGGLKVGRLAVEAGLANRVGTLEETINHLASMDVAEWRKNLNAQNVVYTESQLLNKGVHMADEKKPEAEKKDEIAPPVEKDTKADLDKSITERVSAFFQEKFGASAPVDAKPEDRSEERTAIKAAQAEAEEAKKKATEAKAQIALLQKSARATQFASIAQKWPGEPDKHVAMLELLSQTEGGQESQLFKDYVTQQNAIAEQLKTAALFEEVGSSAPVEGSTAAMVASKVKALRDADPKLTEAQAFDKVWEGLTPKLREQYRTEERVN